MAEHCVSRKVRHTAIHKQIPGNQKDINGSAGRVTARLSAAGPDHTYTPYGEQVLSGQIRVFDGHARGLLFRHRPATPARSVLFNLHN